MLSHTHRPKGIVEIRVMKTTNEGKPSTKKKLTTIDFEGPLGPSWHVAFNAVKNESQLISAIIVVAS